MTSPHPIDFKQYGLAAPLIHIGFPKSLSTWMQRVFFQPENGFYTLMGPIRVQLDIIDNSNFSFCLEKLNQRLEEYISEIDDKSLMPVISLETLAGNMYSGGYDGFENAARLRESFPNAKILIVFREQSSMIRSLYSESVAWGMPHSIRRYLNPSMPRLSPQFSANYLKYDLIVRHYQQRFGKDQVLALPYEMFKVTPKEFVAKIFEHTGASWDQTVAQKKISSIQNPRHTASNILLQRIINRTLVATPWNYNGLREDTGKWSMKRQRRMMVRQLKVPARLNHWLELRIDNEIINFTDDKFKDSNRRLSELTGIDLTTYDYDC